MRPLRYALLGLLCLSLQASAQSDDLVRVRVLEREAPTEVRLEPLDGPADIEVDGRQRGGVWTGEPITIARDRGGVRVRFGGAEVWGAEVRIRSGRLRAVSGRVDRQYLGMVVARDAGSALLLVNHSPTEAYVASVVASEFGFDALEGAKAQAVLARTYAIRRAGATPHYDLDDHTGSQVFRGVEPATATSRRAADETAGEVLVYRGEIAEAFYFSSSGGHTADNDVVWAAGAPVPYLRGVEDPYDRISPDHRWRTTASRDAVLGALSRLVGGRVEGVEVTSRSRSGRVRAVRLIGGERDQITGAQFRRAVNAVAGHRTVRSTRFTLSIEGAQYVFEGSGYGHGVGMSQFGALGMDREGYEYRQILAHYFSGTDVQRRGVAAPPPELIAAASPPPQPVAHPTPRPSSSLRERFGPSSPRTRPVPRREASLSEIFPPPPDLEDRPAPTGDARPERSPRPRDDRRAGGDRRGDGRTGGRRAADRPDPVTAPQRRAAW